MVSSAVDDPNAESEPVHPPGNGSSSRPAHYAAAAFLLGFVRRLQFNAHIDLSGQSKWGNSSRGCISDFSASSWSGCMGTWSAWFADTPESACGGQRPAEAIQRLMAACPERAVAAADLVPLEARTRHDHLEFAIPNRRPSPCPDCGGSGRYVGLQTIETCRTCGGRGTVDCARLALLQRASVELGEHLSMQPSSTARARDGW